VDDPAYDCLGFEVGNEATTECIPMNVIGKSFRERRAIAAPHIYATFATDLQGPRPDSFTAFPFQVHAIMENARMEKALGCAQTRFPNTIGLGQPPAACSLVERLPP
jgi:hypothetical protein